MTDVEKFREALNQSSRIALPLAERAMGLSLTAVEEILAPYPPQPPRDRAKTFNTYVRGIGRYPRSAFAGAKIKTKGAKVRRISERLNTKFRTEVRIDGANVLGELRNEASYSGWVLGSKDSSNDPHQVRPHEQTGWENQDDAIEEAMPDIDRFFDEMLDDFIKELG
jgi:hypothetical protein